MVLGPDGGMVTGCVLEGLGLPDLRAVDAVARQALLAARLGGVIALAEVAPAMSELLELAGLRVEVEGQGKIREEPLDPQEGQEGVHPGDLPA